MNEALIALTGFAFWTLLLVLVVATTRMINSLTGAKKPMNEFSPAGEDMPGFGQRATRAHLNCLEALPIFAAVVVAAGLSDQFAVMEGTVMCVLYARIIQSVIHLISTNLVMVLVRGGLFFAQVALMIYYAVQMLT